MHINWLFPLFIFIFICGGTAVASTGLTVTSATPQGQVEALTQITVRFSENMRPLGEMEDRADTAPLKLKANNAELPKGNFRWLDPATLSYILDAPLTAELAAPLEITCTVPADTKSLSGNALAKAHSWSLRTPPLKISAETYRRGVEKCTIRLQSNYPLDLKSLEKKLSATLGGKKLPLSLSTENSAYLSSSGTRSNWYYYFDINGPLPFDKTIKLRLKDGLKAQGGGEPAPAAELSVPTLESLKMVDWHGERVGKDGPVRPEHGISMEFNNSVAPKDLLSSLRITPAPEPWEKKELEKWLQRDSSHIALPYTFAPRTTYKVALDKKLKDEYGSTLGKTKNFTFQTGDYTPLFHMETGTQVLESALGGRYPLLLRNTGKFTVRLTYIPFEHEKFPQFLFNKLDYDELKELPGVIHKTVDLDFSDRPNRSIRHELDIPAELGFQNPGEVRGMVRLEVELSERFKKETYRSNAPSASLLVTDLGLTYKLGRESGLVWVSSISGGQPLENVNLELVSNSGKKLWGGKSGPDGVAVTPGAKSFPEGNLVFLRARSQDDSSVLYTFGGSLGSNFHGRLPLQYSNSFWDMHVVSQLPLYQPGQTVRFTAYLRKFSTGKDGKLLPVPDWLTAAEEDVTLTVYDARGREVHTAQAKTNKYGSVAGEFQLDASAPHGWYYFKAQMNGGTAAQYRPFKVAAFRPPDFKVDVSAPPSQAVRSKNAEPLKAGVKAAYFSGASLPEAAVAMNVTSEDSRFAPTLLNGFKTGYEAHPFFWHPPYRPYKASPSHRLDGKLDNEGGCAFDLPFIDAPAGFTRDISLEATVTDATGLTSQGNAVFTLHPSNAYVGLRAPFFEQAGREFVVELKAATWDNKPIKDAKVTLRVEKILKDGEKEEVVWSRNVVIKGVLAHKERVSIPDGGDYYLSATITDSSGRANISRKFIYVLGPDVETLRQNQGSHLELLADEPAYAPGATAKIMYSSPFDTATALITVERQGVISHRVEQVTGPSPSFEIPLAKKDAPYVFATVTLIKGRSTPPPVRVTEEADSDQDKGAPQVRYGVVCLKVEDPDKDALSVSVTTDQKEYRPGGKVKAVVSVKDRHGKAAKAQVTLLAVDNRILRASGEETWTYHPSASFGQIYTYDFINSDMRKLLVNLNLPMLLGFAKSEMDFAPAMRMSEAVSAPEPASAGQDGAEASVRGNFSPMAYWLAAGETDRKGRLEAEFTLPDTLTSYRIVAIAADAGSLFSETEKEITASKPLQLLSALPRFASEGDRIEARILVQNMSKDKQAIKVTASGQGLSIEENVRTITLEAGASGTVSFPVIFGQPGLAALQVAGSMGREQDGAVFTVPVKAVLPLTTVAAAGQLKAGESHTLPVKLPEALDKRSKLEVIFAPSPAAGLPLVAQNLLDYPWGCLEQRLSRAWVRLLRLKHGEMIGLAADEKDAEAILSTFKALEDFQRYDGGLGMWPSSRNEPSLFISAYALLLNREAKSLGLSMNPETESRVLSYLEEQLRNYRRNYSVEAKAFALWMLAEYAHLSAQDLYKALLQEAFKQDLVNPLGWSSLYMTGTRMGLKKDDANQRKIIDNLEKAVVITPTQMHFRAIHEYGSWQTLGSTLRDNGMVLAALSAKPGQSAQSGQPGQAEENADYPRLEALANWLAQGLGEKKYLSTQESIFGLWGLASYLESLGGDQETSVNAKWNDNGSVSKSFKKLIDAPESWTLDYSKIAGHADSSIFVKAEQGSPYWTARLSYASAGQKLEPENAGIIISRKWVDPGPWKVGDVVNIEVTVQVPATRRHVYVFDPFPAGLEALYASRVDIEEDNKDYQYPWQVQEYRDDGLFLYASQVDPGIYTYRYALRAATPGTFTQRPSIAEEMYTPEVFGRTGTDEVVVVP